MAEETTRNCEIVDAVKEDGVAVANVAQVVMSANADSCQQGKCQEEKAGVLTENYVSNASQLVGSGHYRSFCPSETLRVNRRDRKSHRGTHTLQAATNMCSGSVRVDVVTPDEAAGEAEVEAETGASLNDTDGLTMAMMGTAKAPNTVIR